MTKASLVTVLLVITFILTGVVTGWAATLKVGPSEPYASIQTAINAASNGDTVWIANGTYSETLDIAKDITLAGESEAGVTIDTSTFNDYGIYVSGDHTVVMKNFTVKGPLPATYGYGIKVSGENADITIHNVTVKDSGRSGIDLNGVAHGDLKGITVIDNGGVGLALTDSSNITVDGITTSGNAWGGMAIYTYGKYYTGGSDNITLTGTNSFGEATGLYTEIENSSDPAHPYPITNLHIPLSDFGYMVSSNSHPNVVAYYPDLTTASGAAVAGDPNNAFINDRSTGDFIVVPGLKIQSAVIAAHNGDKVVVEPGTYTEQILINTNIAMNGGAGASVTAPTSGTQATYMIAESSARFAPIIFAYGGTMAGDHVSGTGVANVDVKDLDIDGHNRASAGSRFTGILYRNVNGTISGNFIHRMFGADGKGDGPQTFGILIYGNSHVDVSNNSVGEFSRGGIVIMGDAGSAPDPVAHVAGNTVTGNGMETETNWWAENGIQIGYGASGDIVGNTVANCQVNNPYWTATGIMVIDTHNVQVKGNRVNNNQTGISVTDVPAAWGFPWNVDTVSNVTVEGNSLNGNDWALDIANDVSNVAVLRNVFTNTTSDAIDVWNYGLGDPYPTNVTAHYNSITGSGGDGLWVMDGIGSPVDATLNWWGSASGPSGEGPGSGDSVSKNVIFSPWLGIDPDVDPATPGVQLVSPLVFIVDDVGPAPAAGYLNTAIAAANTLPGADTIKVDHGTYTATTPITDGVTIVSQQGSAANTHLSGNITLNARDIIIGRMRQGFSIHGNVTVNAGVDASTIHINWNDIYGTVINDGIGTLDATYNYWNGNTPWTKTTGLVDYYPYLPDPTAVIIGYIDDLHLTPDDAITYANLTKSGMVGADALTVLQLMHAYGFSREEAQQLVRQYGRVRIHLAMMGAHSLHEFSVNLLGYSRSAGGGGSILGHQIAGGGGSINGITVNASYTQGEPIHIAFTLTDPITGKTVTNAIATLSVVEVTPGKKTSLVYWGMIPYDKKTGQYTIAYDTSGLEPGYYDLFINTNDGQTQQFRVKITKP